jgi:3-methyladenine DNA glycosylase AlkD
MTDLVSFARRRLAAAADPAKAAPMAAYLKTSDPFYGVQKPARDRILRELKRRFPIDSAAQYERAVVELWALPHREEKYLAVATALAYPRFIVFERLPLYRRLITEGAWWDLVDDLAARAVGRVWQNERERTTPVMRDWVDDEDLWLRRTALIGQLKHKADTDAALLFEFCVERAHETEFFIRKAIGWALREHAKTNPGAVRAFADAHRSELSGLSYREATKHL